MTQTTRRCATCGIPITVTSRNPRRRYCTPRCRVADWHQHNRTRTPNPTSGVANGVDDARTVANAVGNQTNDVSPATAASIATLARCPTCRTPLTVLTWLLPPAAAQVATPNPSSHG